MDVKEFLKTINEVANADTSVDPPGWTFDNPLWGHCAVVSLLAQEIFGGELMKGSLGNYPKYAYLRSHIWNRINSQDIDFTESQYRDLSCKDLAGEVRMRDSILNHANTLKRFLLLKERFLKARDASR